MARIKKSDPFGMYVDRDISRAGRALFQRSNSRGAFDYAKAMGRESAAKKAIAQVRGKSKTINSIFKTK